MFAKYQKFKPFSTTEAWTLFKLAAIGEAVGWTLLISGILLGHFIHSNIPVLICGQIHGTLFIIYFAAAVLTAPSQGWPLSKAITALLSGVPPYGSLAFELWQSHQMAKDRLRLDFVLSLAKS